MEFIILIIFVILLVVVLNLRGRVVKLENLLQSRPVEKQSILPSVPQAMPLSAPLPPMASVNQYPIQTSEESVWVDTFIAWIKEDWLLKLGALLLLIGFGWLTTYAFLHNWIGPVGRITLGLIAGVFFLILGWWRIQKYINQGGIFLVLGSSIVLLVVFAAREIYNFFPPFVALAMMFLSTAFVALASVRYRNKYIAVASLVLAGIAPLLINAEVTNYVGIFSYLLVVVLGAIWVMAITNWRELTPAALILVTFYSLPHFSHMRYVEGGVLLPFAFAFSSIFFITSTLGILKQKKEEITADLITAGANGLFLLTWILTDAQDEWKSLIIAAWMLVFACGAFLVFKLTERKEPFYVYASVGIVMLGAATAEELHGSTLTLAYTLESAIIIITSFFVMRDIKLAEKLSFLLFIPASMSVQSMVARVWRTSVFHKDFFVLFVLSLTLFGLSALLWYKMQGVVEKRLHYLRYVLTNAGSVYMYILLWLSMHAMFKDDLAVMISLVVYTLVGLVVYFYARMWNKRGFLIYGGTMLGVVLLRLFLVEVWRMELSGRIITFFLIGALLVSTAFLGRKRHDIIQ